MYPVPIRLPKGANIRRLSRQEYPLKPQTSSTYSSDIAYPKNSECRHSLSFNCSPRAEPSGFTQTHVQYPMQRWIDDTEGDRVIADINFNPRSSNFGVCQNNPRSSLSATDHETDSTSASEWTKSHTETAHSDGFSTDEAVLNYLGAWCSDEVKRDGLEENNRNVGAQQIEHLAGVAQSILEHLEYVLTRFREVINDPEMARPLRCNQH